MPDLKEVVARTVLETFIQRAELHDEVGSTNDVALERERTLELPAGGDQTDAAPAALLVVSRRQTSGRGRGANAWWSNDGSLLFSLLLDAPSLGLQPQHWPRVSLAAALAVGEAIESMVEGLRVRLKWPNDVFLSGKKLCGILVESPPHASGKLVIGVGINVNNSFQAAPPDLAGIATSLLDATGETLHRTDLLCRILSALDRNLFLLSQNEWELDNIWRERCLLRGKPVRLLVGDRRIRGTCLEVNREGALVLQTEGGAEPFFAGIVEKFG